MNLLGVLWAKVATGPALTQPLAVQHVLRSEVMVMLRSIIPICVLSLAACNAGTDQYLFQAEAETDALVIEESFLHFMPRAEDIPPPPGRVENLPPPPMPKFTGYGNQGPASDAGAAAIPGAMLIRNGNARLEVRAVDSAITTLRAVAQQFGGEIGNISVNSRERYREAQVELRVPSESFDAALAALDSLGKVEAVGVTATDVGEEYVDLGIRMANSRRLEQRLTELLSTRTGKLDEILAVERELARVRSEIERHEGRVRYLEARVAMSTIAIALHEPRPIMDSGRSGGIVRNSFRGAWSNFVGLIAGSIELSGVILPLGLVLGFSFTGVRRWRRERRD